MTIEMLLLLAPHVIFTIIAAGILYVGYTLAAPTVSRFCACTGSLRP